ncbi:MAG: hypothetical protein ACI4R5_08900 [Acetatifactor sp.]
MFRQKIKALKLWKRRPVQILTVLTLLCLVGCMIRMLMPNRSYCHEEAYIFQPGIATEMQVVYSGISLRPGVYYIEMEYEAECDGVNPVAYTNMQDGTVITGGLCTNGEHLYAGTNKSGYHMWLYESTDDLQMAVSYSGNGQLKVLGYTITETNQLWSMYLVIILFISLLVFCIMAYCYYDREYCVAAEKKQVFFFVMLISLFASLPYLYEGNLNGIDLTYHLQRIEGVKDGFLSGQLPLRIEPEWLFGHGYAAGVFYCNSLLYFPAILRLLGFTVTASYNIYCIALTIATAWIAWYCFCKIFDSRNIGIVCCALYTLSTFRIYKLVNTCAMGEGSAVAFMPLVLYGMWRVFTENPKEKKYKTAWLPIAVGYAGLIQTHILTCEITALVTLLVCIVCIRRVLCRNTFWELAKGALGAIGLSLWFLVPFLDYYFTQNVHIKNLSSRTIQSKGMTLAHLAFHFWRNGSYTPNGETGVFDTHPVGVGFVLILGLFVFAALGFCGAFRKVKGSVKQLGVASACLGGLLLFMSTNLFPWDYIRALNGVTAALVSSLEFPHRVLGWGTLFLVTVCGFCLWYFKRCNRLHYLVAVTVAVVCVITSGLYLVDFVTEGWNEVILYNEEGMGFGFISDGEYLIEGTDAGKLTYAGALVGEGVTVTDYEKEYLRVSVNCANTGGRDSYVELPLLFYKGYRAVDCNTGGELAVCAGDNNVVRVPVPAGFAGNIEVKFVSPLYWRISELVSAGSIVILLSVWLKERRKGDRRDD